MDVFGFLLLVISVFVIYAISLSCIYLLRRILWWFAGIFYLIDEVVWFLYNPFRVFMKDRSKSSLRVFHVIFIFALLKPVYQIFVYLLTTPLRIVTAVYFDVIMYLFVMTSDTIEELFRPRLQKMRHRKGLDYLFKWVVFLPYRLIMFFVKNCLAIIDSIMMAIISISLPTFTMYHGTNQDAVVDISRKNRWLVGGGNFAGSGIYFGRKIKVAKHYSKACGVSGKQVHPIIVARVTFSLLRNCGTFNQETKELIADRSGYGGRELAQKVRFPYRATEFWREDHRWWEYCLLQGGKDGEFIHSWRIRPVGYLHVNTANEYHGSLQRLWGGKGHYCLSLVNIGVVSLIAFYWTVFFSWFLG